MKNKSAVPDRGIAFLLAIILTLSLSSCMTSRSTHYASSVMEYLYPNKSGYVVEPDIPVLSLPLRVGIAFVPAGRSYAWRAGKTTEAKKTEIMNKVADHFRKYKFVKSIEVIPSPYLKPKGGFANLDQLRTMYGLDVIALISIDQTQFTDENFLSITYWTIVGAYVVPGNKNATHTMIDVAVYDIRSRKFLFRAPGISQIKGLSTAVGIQERLRIDRERGLVLAAGKMTINLDQQLQLFRKKVKQRPKEYTVRYRKGYSGGGGAIDPYVLMLMVLMAGLLAWSLPRRRLD